MILLVEDGELKAEAPAGILDDEIRSYLRDRRPAVIEVLTRRQIVKDRIAAAHEASQADSSIDWGVYSKAIETAESDLEASVVSFVDGETDIEAVASAWKILIKLRKVPDVRTRAAVY